MEAYELPAGTYLDHNKYIIEKVLGSGGFGITYLGNDISLKRKVAIKELFSQYFCYRNPGDPNVYLYQRQKGKTFEDMKRQFVEEGQVLALLGEQPGVVNVHTIFQENNTAYFVMEYVEGQSLKDYLEQKGGRLTVAQTLAIMRPVIRALGGVHRQQVVHRDISPDNIMITKDRKVKLIDFGAAKKDVENYNFDRVLKGSYSPLEQVEAQGQIGPYSDIYALCATMYYCITGTKIMTAKERLQQDLVVPPSALGIPISPQDEAALMQGLALYPYQRIQDADSLYYYLYGCKEQTQQTQQTQGTPGATLTNMDMSKILLDMQQEQKKKTRTKKWISIACTLLIIGISAGSYFFMKKQKETPGTNSDVVTDNGVQSAGDKLEDVDCEAYAQEFYNLCEKQHTSMEKPISRRSEFDSAAAYTAQNGAQLTYAGTDELNAGLAEIGNRAIELYKIPNTGWVAYTFSLKENVSVVKKTLDTYIAQMNAENQGTVNLDNCEYLGVSVARADDGTFFWAVFYR